MSSGRCSVVNPLRVFVSSCAFALLAALSGCGGGEPFGYVNVPGKITYEDGTPIGAPHLRLTFIPVNPPASSDPKISAPKAKADVTAPDGTIPADSISSHLYGDGLLPGKHKVQIIPYDEHDQPMPGLVPQEYREVKTTPVEVDTTNAEGLIIKIKKPAAGKTAEKAH